MTPAGERDKIVAVERATVTEDAHGGEVPTWAPYCRERAKVRYGTGQEARAAAQEQASQVATVTVPANSATRGITPKDRAVFDGGDWNIVAAEPIGRAEVRLTVRRAA